MLLPDGDGVDLLKELRSSRGNALPVLMLSTEAEVNDRIRGITTGANEYVGKPYDALYVVAKARKLLGASGAGLDAQAIILVIDDSDTYRNRLAEVLEGAGYRVLLAENGKAGLAMIADRRPNAVIVDGVMPDMDGATLIRRVRLDAAMRALPCVLLTASEEGGAQLRALEAGADAFVRKDSDMDVILARLGAVMRRQADRPLEQVASLSGPRKILAVDDSLAYLNELAETLRAEGHEVCLARSGEEALDLLAVQPVDCILMDLMMPGMGGKEACVRIKAATGVRDIPLILLTAHDDRTAMLEGLGAGADDYISKSSEFEVLCARVLAQIRRKQFEDENRRYREELLGRELAATEERSARVLAEARAAMVDELERKIEERPRELEAAVVERRQAERMASVGMLSASLAHEINNPLAVVIANLELVILSLNELASESGFKALTNGAGGDLAAQMMDRLGTAEDPLCDALEAAERMREIVRDLRIFARSEGEDGTQPVDLHKVIDSTFRMASNEIRHRARLLKAFGEIPLVQANESRLAQVFLNLIVNAAQAMPVGQAAENEIRVSTATEGRDGVVVEVADTGVGIPEDKLDRVFDPFSTTKAAGAGTGLGLAICRRIITELGGSISVRSEVGKGTVFRVILRRATTPREVAAVVAAAPAAPTAVKRGPVLVVDDETALCKTIERILSADHEVVAVTSAKQAVSVIESGDRFDLILSDVMMPEMTGMELYSTLDESVPDQARRMIFMTGGAFSPDAAKFLRLRHSPSIEKPFRPSAVRCQFDNRVLSERGASAMTRIDDTLAEIADVRLADQIPDLLGRVGAAYGMKTVAYLGTGTLDRTLPRREPYLAVTYSSEWVEHYRARGYVKIDPVIQTGLRRLLPIDWGDFSREDAALRQFFGEAAEFGLGRKGMSFPVHGHGGDRALFSVSADFSEREWQWARRTAFRQFPVIAAHLHDAVLRTEGALRPQPHLSPRELECLQWTSEGKTVWECGMVLGLSSHTVRCYLESARHKLGASSNTHAVSIALKSGLLFDLP